MHDIANRPRVPRSSEYVVIQMMVSIKEAAANASAFAKAALGEKRTGGIRLEEIESATLSDGGAWIVTLSMIDQNLQLAISTDKIRLVPSQCRRWRTPLKTMAAPRRPAAAITASSRTLPPGWMNPVAPFLPCPPYAEYFCFHFPNPAESSTFTVRNCGLSY